VVDGNLSFVGLFCSYVTGASLELLYSDSFRLLLNMDWLKTVVGGFIEEFMKSWPPLRFP